MIAATLWAYMWCLTTTTERCQYPAIFATQPACAAHFGQLKALFANPPATMTSNQKSMSIAAAGSMWIYIPCHQVPTGAVGKDYLTTGLPPQSP
jgi:hypothetical protein